jgi:hypothetical protein
MVKAQLLLTAAAVAVVGAFSPNAPQTVRLTELRTEKMQTRSGLWIYEKGVLKEKTGGYSAWESDVSALAFHSKERMRYIGPRRCKVYFVAESDCFT